MTSFTARANAECKPPREITIATPCYGGMMTTAYALSAVSTIVALPERGVTVRWRLLGGESLIQRARNELAAHFLADSESERLLFIDADIEFTAADVLRIISHDVDGVACLCPIKEVPVTRFAIDWKEGAVQDTNTGLREVTYAGTGFLCIKREVFVRLAAAYPASRITKRRGMDETILRFLHDFFPVYIEDGRLLGEDYGFCQRWASIGGKIWADTGVALAHHGQHRFAAV